MWGKVQVVLFMMPLLSSTVWTNVKGLSSTSMEVPSWRTVHFHLSYSRHGAGYKLSGSWVLMGNNMENCSIPLLSKSQNIKMRRWDTFMIQLVQSRTPERPLTNCFTITPTKKKRRRRYRKWRRRRFFSNTNQQRQLVMLCVLLCWWEEWRWKRKGTRAS